MVQGKRRRGWRIRTVYDKGMEELQRRAEAMTRGDFSSLGQPIGVAPSVENVRRALDVMGAHVAQGHRTMHDYIATLTTAQEAERGRIARELHDDTVQRLIALGQGIERAQRALQHDPALSEERLSALRAEVTSLVHAVRSVIADLRPPALAELGLLPAVELLLKHGTDQLDVRLTVAGTTRRLDEPSELALFRIIQEAWSNIQRHARARHVTLHFSYTRNALVMTIKDDGQGFVQPDVRETTRRGYGLLGIQERAALVGGTVAIISHPGAGTHVEVRIPYLGLEGRDPVCGMEVGPEALSVEFENQLYRFCSEACRDLFAAQSLRYVHHLPADDNQPGSAVR